MSDPYGRASLKDEDVRCWRCGRLLAEMLTRPWAIRCGRCKAQNMSGQNIDRQPGL